MIIRHDTRAVYTNRWMTVREDQIAFPNGTRGVYGGVDKPDFVAVAPIDTLGHIHLVRQYRYPVEGAYWEVPQRSWEDTPGTEVALAELREETGLRAGHLTRIAHLLQAPGYSSQGCHLFLAEGLVGAGGHGPQGARVKRMAAEGTISDATTIAALGMLLLAGRLEMTIDTR